MNQRYSFDSKFNTEGDQVCRLGKCVSVLNRCLDNLLDENPDFGYQAVSSIFTTMYFNHILNGTGENSEMTKTIHLENVNAMNAILFDKTKDPDYKPDGYEKVREATRMMMYYTKLNTLYRDRILTLLQAINRSDHDVVASAAQEFFRASEKLARQEVEVG